MRGLACLGLMFVVLAYSAPLARGQAAPAPPGSPITTVSGTIAAPAPGAPVQPAIAVTSVPSPASPQNPTDQIMWALAMSYLLKFATKKGWGISDQTSSRVKAFAGFAVAACTAAGIHMAVNGSFFSGDGAAVSITGLSFDAFKDIGFQWVSQQGWYDTIVKKVA